MNYYGADPFNVASPQLVGRRFGYAHDNIGNRRSATRALGTTVGDIFAANALNQYATRENDVTYTAGTAKNGGTPQSTSIITVSGSSAVATVGRAGGYWGAELTIGNTSAPAKVDLTITATLPGAGTNGADLVQTGTRTAYLAKALQNFTYDADGNLIGDGVWNYAYDAENRLTQMTTTEVALTAGFPNRTLEFKYDYLGRRVQKRSLNATTSVETWRRYLYDGWDLVAEFDAPSGTSCGNLLKSYTWGLDLAGSLTFTGGVGALLQLTDHTTSTSYFPTYDGNGNVAALVRSDGVTAAKYEYSPFGELLRAEGAYAASNPFRFSTKFTDDESGLVYYGARFYSPGLGRFLNRDPIEEAGGLNLYGFCGNDAINHLDYLGNSWLSKQLKSIGNWFSKNKQAIIMAVAVVASIFVGYEVAGMVQNSIATSSVGAIGGGGIDAAADVYAASAGLTSTHVIAGIAGGAAGGAVAGGITTGTVKGALQGAAAGAIMGGIAGYYGNNYTLPRVGVTAIGGGIASEIQGGSFRRGFEISGLISLDTWAAVKAREYMWEQSNKYVDKNGVAVNATGDSDGYKGIGGKLGGVRATVTGYDSNGDPILSFPPGPLGGSQGGPGQTFGWAYAAGSLRDHLVEAYAGVHDFVNWPFSYNSMGNNEAVAAPWGRYIAAVGGPGAANFVSGAMSWVNVPVATPIVLGSAIPESAYPILINPPPRR